jgi:hypothetical protein
VTRFFDLDQANELIPEVRTILEGLRDERAELIRLRDQVLLHRSATESPAIAPSETTRRRPGPGRGAGLTDPEASEGGEDASGRDPEVRVLRLRMQGVIDQMQAGVARIDELGVTLREIETGLIDFPALVAGRQVWLCWRLGEDDVAWWHELGDGFGGRQALSELH